VIIMTSWTTTSWQQKPCGQLLEYPSPDEVNASMRELSQLPPLVTPMEITHLKAQLAKASRGEAFLLQGGDCAESFANCRSTPIINKLKILLQMSLILIHGLKKPVIRVGRIAGQYAKPRSEPLETRNGVTLPTYRGDLINRPGFTKEERIPDPRAMIEGYHYSAVTLNYIRGLVGSGFADLQHPEYWDLDFVKHSELADEYHTLVKSIGETLTFIKTISGVQASRLNSVDFFTSHEALNLYYEQPLTRKHSDHRYYDLSTHFPWIGMRTAELDGAHVEFFRGIANPVAVKIGPKTDPKELLALIHILNPEDEPGRLTLTVRLGAKNVSNLLPRLIEAVQKEKKNVLWSCDPMHGNTGKTAEGIKTRHFDDILSELTDTFRLHKEMGSHLGGVHFELTGENVTECIGGARGLSESDLTIAYESLCDPRLNYEQALEMAMLIVKSEFHL